MKYPTEIILSLRDNNELHIKFEKVIYLATKDMFQATILITNELVENALGNEGTVYFITEDREF